MMDESTPSKLQSGGKSSASAAAVRASTAKSPSRSFFLRASDEAQRMPLKEKFVQIYEQFFQGNDPSVGQPFFWDELFLLKVNFQFFKQAVGERTIDELMALKNTFNLLFVRCTAALGDDNPVRVLHALETLQAMFHNVFAKKFPNFGFDVINLLIGFDQAEERFRGLVLGLQPLICQPQSDLHLEHALRLLSIIVTATDNINQNTFVEFLMVTSLFDPLVKIFGNARLRALFGFHTLFIIAVLTCYMKYESANPYLTSLSDLSDEIILDGLGAVVVELFDERNRLWTSRAEAARPQGLLGSLSSIVGHMFVPSEDVGVKASVSTTGAVLLALYETVLHNAHFVTVLTHTQVLDIDKEEASQAAGAATPAVTPEQHSRTLLSTFFTFTSFVLADCNETENTSFAKLCLIILTNVTEDQHANAYLHNTNVHAPVCLHKPAMRHRPASTVTLPPGPLAIGLLDLTIEFLTSHLRRNLQSNLHSKCLGIVHRMLCYQKKHRVRLSYNWKDLWIAMLGLVKFILVHEHTIDVTCNVYGLIDQVINIFNLFVTYGDTFLPDPNSYDELYYEVIREQTTFDSLYECARKHVREQGPHAVVAGKVATHLINIRAITNHFSVKIDAWTRSNPTTQLTPEQVLTVVRDNYDTLTLKLQDNLESYEKFSENPAELPFITQVLRNVVCTNRIADLHHDRQR